MGALFEARRTDITFVRTKSEMAIVVVASQSIGEIEYFATFSALVRSSLLMPSENMFLEIAFFSKLPRTNITCKVFHFQMNDAFMLPNSGGFTEQPAALITGNTSAFLTSFGDAPTRNHRRSRALLLRKSRKRVPHYSWIFCRINRRGYHLR